LGLAQGRHWIGLLRISRLQGELCHWPRLANLQSLVVARQIRTQCGETKAKLSIAKGHEFLKPIPVWPGNILLARNL
jgi:hypothetical protein